MVLPQALQLTRETGMRAPLARGLAAQGCVDYGFDAQAHGDWAELLRVAKCTVSLGLNHMLELDARNPGFARRCRSSAHPRQVS